MNIYAKKGDKVVFLNRNGRSYERVDAVAAGLVLGLIYTVESVEVQNWCSFVKLAEVEGSFNTVMFADVEEVEPVKKEEPSTMNIGQADQAMAAILDMAKLTKKHYDSCLDAGFTKAQALTLAVEFQKNIMMGGGKK